MYLHVGEDIVVRTNDVIVIIDESSSLLLKDFLNHNDNRIYRLSKGIIKSFVVTNDSIYESPFSSQTLKKRCRLKSL